MFLMEQASPRLTRCKVKRWKRFHSLCFVSHEYEFRTLQGREKRTSWSVQEIVPRKNSATRERERERAKEKNMRKRDLDLRMYTLICAYLHVPCQDTHPLLGGLTYWQSWTLQCKLQWKVPTVFAPPPHTSYSPACNSYDWKWKQHVFFHCSTATAMKWNALMQGQ